MMECCSAPQPGEDDEDLDFTGVCVSTRVRACTHACMHNLSLSLSLFLSFSLSLFLSFSFLSRSLWGVMSWQAPVV